MRIFRKQDGGIVQLIGKKEMLKWPIELPLIFIEYIRANKLATYDDAKVRKGVSAYLDEVLKDVAIPRLISVLEGSDQDEIQAALERISEIAKKNLEMTRPIKPYLDKLFNNKRKSIVNLARGIIKLFEKEKRRKESATLRKIMEQKEKAFLAGKINATEYAKARKDYLIAKG